MKTLIICLSLSANVLAASKPSRALASVRHSLRVEHARELMGKSYKKSAVSKIEKKKDVESHIFSLVKKRLPKKYKTQSTLVAKAIIEEASSHSLDPYFVMAVIAGESSFNPDAKGPVGEIGLMQLRSSTGEWIAKLSGNKWKGDKTLRDPVMNIRLGVAYLGWLREKFEGHGQLYVAAYNMGPKSVKNALSRNVYPKDYPKHVMKRYIAFYKDMDKTSL